MTMTPTTTDERATDDEAPSSSMAVVRAGHQLSRDLLQELAVAVALTAQRERQRRSSVIAVMSAGVVAAFLGADSSLARLGDFSLPLLVVCGLGLGLPMALAWGVRNRALLNAVADAAAIDHHVLAHAVSLVRTKGVGPSTALLLALSPAKRSEPVGSEPVPTHGAASDPPRERPEHGEADASETTGSGSRLLTP
jgi:hypothetical protein